MQTIHIVPFAKYRNAHAKACSAARPHIMAAFEMSLQRKHHTARFHLEEAMKAETARIEADRNGQLKLEHLIAEALRGR